MRLMLRPHVEAAPSSLSAGPSPPQAIPRNEVSLFCPASFPPSSGKITITTYHSHFSCMKRKLFFYPFSFVNHAPRLYGDYTSAQFMTMFFQHHRNYFATSHNQFQFTVDSACACLQEKSETNILSISKSRWRRKLGCFPQSVSSLRR
jgi:hypothetical protein